MKFELDLIRATREVPFDVDLKARRRDTTGVRKELREVTDAVVLEALPSGSFVQIVYLSSAAALTVADALDRMDEEPEARDLIVAAQAMLVSARSALDRALLLQDWPGVRAGAASVELCVRGLFSALNVPYEDALATSHMQGTVGIESLLVARGLKKGASDGSKGEDPQGDVGRDGAGGHAGDPTAGDGEVGLPGGGGDRRGD